MLSVEAALVGGDVASARSGAKALEAEALTARLAGLFARAAFAAGAPDEARMWLARGAGAPREPDWSDLDPEGRAFAYLPSDWARLVVSFAETGELVHPRLDRRERGMAELPDLPISYADPAAIEAQAHDPSPYLVGEGLYEDGENDPPPPRGPQNPPGLPARRRLASGRRESK
jgi:HemY protein